MTVRFFSVLRGVRSMTKDSIENSLCWRRHIQMLSTYVLFRVFIYWTSPLLDNIRVMVIVCRLRVNIIRTAGNIVRTALCWILWHNVHSQQHIYVNSSCSSNRSGLSHWDHYAVHRGGCLELYYYNMVEWFWWDLSLILTTNWFPSVLWHCWFGHLAFKNCRRNDLLCVEWDVKPYTLAHYFQFNVWNTFVDFYYHPQMWLW